MKDSLAPFQGANAIPCPLGMDIELIRKELQLSSNAIIPADTVLPA
jgi:hypothetical protein